MENKVINLEITEKDKIVYDFLKGLKSNRVKEVLEDAVVLYCQSVGDEGFQRGFASPERKEEEIKSYSIDQLKELKEKYLYYLTLSCECVHPKYVECGVKVEPYNWFVNDGSTLGDIALYTSYIKVIEKLLKDKGELACIMI